jgi:hypothetical protein
LHCEEVPIFKDFAPYLSHNPATFWRYVSRESPVARGAAGGHHLKEPAIFMNPSPFPYGLETSRDLQTIVVRDSGLPLGL